MTFENYEIELINKKILSKFKPNNEALLTGLSGFVLFQYHYSEYCKENSIEFDYSNFEKNISKIIRLMNNSISSNSFCDGLAGTGYLLQLLANLDIIDMNSSYLDEVDDMLNSYAINSIVNNKWDYLHGGLGIVNYFLIRNNTKSEFFLQNCVKILDNLAIKKDNVLYWQSKVRYEEGLVQNFGLSHGIPSIVCCISKIADKGIEYHLSKKLVIGAIDYILGFERTVEDGYSCFPDYILEEQAKNYYGRLAWCYGDLCISIMLINAGNIFKCDEWIEKGIKIAHTATKRVHDNLHSCKDYGFCHGYFGTSYLFLKYYYLTGDDSFKNASMFLLKKGKDYIFKSKSKRINSKVYMHYETLIEEYSLLSGLSGIGLTMLGHNDKKFTKWDDILLLFPTHQILT